MRRKDPGPCEGDYVKSEYFYTRRVGVEALDFEFLNDVALWFAVLSFGAIFAALCLVKAWKALKCWRD